MAGTPRYADRVERAVDRLRERHGEFRRRRQEWEVTGAEYAATSRRAARGTIGGAGAWVRRETEAGREALLVRESGAWSEPAGKQEPGESLAETARRELREETGVSVELDGIRLATRAIHTHGDRPPVARLVVVFDARPTADGRPTPHGGEVERAAWLDDHPDELRYDAVGEFPI